MEDSKGMMEESREIGLETEKRGKEIRRIKKIKAEKEKNGS